MLSFLLNCKRIYNDFIKDEVTVYAAQASFFIVLSAAPFIMILLTLIQLIPAVSPEDLMHVMTQLLPSSIHPLIESVIQDIQTVSKPEFSTRCIRTFVHRFTWHRSKCGCFWW